MRPQAILPAIVLLGVGTAALADADPYLGTAVRMDERAQVIDLNPHYVGDPSPGGNGQKAVRAFTRYELDREKVIILPSNDPQTGRPGTPVNGSGELLNGSQIISGDNASGQGSTGQRELVGAGGSSIPAESGSKTTGGAGVSR